MSGESNMGARELERLCIAQLGGGPWFFNERIDTQVCPFPTWLRKMLPGETPPEPFRPFRVQRIGSMRYVDKNGYARGEDRGPLYVEGYSWDDCATQMGIQVPAA